MELHNSRWTKTNLADKAIDKCGPIPRICIGVSWAPQSIYVYENALDHELTTLTMEHILTLGERCHEIHGLG